MIITRVEPARANSLFNGGIELDPLSVDVLVAVELELHLEDAILIDQLRGLQEGTIQFHRLPLRRRDDLRDVEEAGFLELVDLAIACRNRDVILVADLLDGPRRPLRSD